MTRILALSAGLSQPSTTRLLADRLATVAQLDCTVAARDIAHPWLPGFTGGVCQ